MVMKFFKDLVEKISGTTYLKYENEDEDQDEYVEVVPKKDTGKTKVQIKYFVISDYSDVKGILDFVREGYSIIFAKIKTLKNKDVTELKRAILKIKKTCEAVGGDIVGIDEDFILIIPSYAKVSKEDFE